MDEVFKAVLASYAGLLPVMLVFVAGFIVAVIRWKHHPGVSLLACIAFAGFFLVLLIDTYLSIWLPSSFRMSRDMSHTELGNILAVKNIVFNVVRMILWALVIIALFGWRGQQERPSSGGTPVIPTPQA